MTDTMQEVMKELKARAAAMLAAVRALEAVDGTRAMTTGKVSRRRRHISAKGRLAIKKAQQARWAKWKKLRQGR